MHTRGGARGGTSPANILDLARFWSCDPLLRGYDPLIRGSLVKGSNIRPLVKGVARGIPAVALEEALLLGSPVLENDKHRVRLLVRRHLHGTYKAVTA